MAMLLEIYDKLIYSVDSVRSVKSRLFLGTFSVGGVIGILLFSQPLLALLERYPMQMLYFFMGAVGGGVPLILSKAEVRRFSKLVFVWPTLGMVLVWMLFVLLQSSVQSGMSMGLGDIAFLVITGVIAAMVLVLPGISVSLSVACIWDL
ncbi:MAG: undecaprenyl phosphate translocase family protein [Eisenbergiella massiliensis]